MFQLQMRLTKKLDALGADFGSQGNYPAEFIAIMQME
jgi:hypothetical protein